MSKKDRERVFRERAASFNTLRFHWEVEGRVAGSAVPGRGGNPEEDFRTLQEAGIDTIISLTRRPLQVPPAFDGAFDVVHVPVDDGTPPGEEQLEAIIRRVREAVDAGKRTVVHCRGGIGRTATVLIPLLMELEGLSLEEATNRVRASGRFTQSGEQKAFLERWAGSRGSR